MRKQGRLSGFWRYVRAAAILDVGLLALAGVICLVIGQWSLPLCALLLRWAGVAIIFAALLTAAGGLNSRVEDVAAYSLTGAGDMGDHLRRLTQETGSRWGCLIAPLLAGILALGLGFLLQFTANQFGIMP